MAEALVVDKTLEVFAEAVHELRESTREYLRNLKSPPSVKQEAYQEMKAHEEIVDTLTHSILRGKAPKLREQKAPNGLFRGYHPQYSSRRSSGGGGY